MSFLDLFRRKKKNDNFDIDDFTINFVEQESENDDLEKQSLGELEEDLKKWSKKQVMDEKMSWKQQAAQLCEELVEATQTLEEQKTEYQLVSAYLKDIQLLFDLPSEQFKPIEDSARQIIKLDVARTQFINSEHKLSDTKFSQFQNEENDMPRIIRHLEENERDLEKVQKDLKLLEGEKMEWSMLKEDQQNALQFLKKLSILMLFFFSILCILIFTLGKVFEFESQLFMLLVAFFAVLFAAFVIVRYQNANSEIKRCDINRNYAIKLEKQRKYKMVHIKRAVEYTQKKYGVSNSKDLLYQFEQYQEMLKDKARFRQTSDDLMYYSNRLVRQLDSLGLYDSRIWLQYIGALLDRNEMIELKHNMLKRRQKVRSNIEEELENMKQLRAEIEDYIHNSGDDMKQIRIVLSRLDRIDSMKPFSYN